MRGMIVRRRARQDDRAGRAVRRRQVHRVQPDPALLRDRARHRSRSTARTSPRCRAARCASRSPMSDRTCSCSTARSARTSPSASRAPAKTEIVAAAKAAHAHEFIIAVSARLRHAGRRARRAAFRRRAPAHRHRARADQERADHPARRGDRLARFRIRAAGAGRDGRICARAAPPSPSRTACTPSPTPTASWWSRTARSSNPAGTTNCCARAAATPRSTGCRSSEQEPRPPIAEPASGVAPRGCL